MNPARLSIGVIHIVESLPRQDLKTGAWLRDELSGLIAAGNEPLPLHYQTARTKRHLMSALRHIEDEAAARAPILHLETHGVEGGIMLASGEHVSWAELKGPLTGINIACHLNLLVFMAACDGEALASTVVAHEPAPVWGLIGPRDTVEWSAIASANTAFYQTLVSTGDGVQAVDAMRAATGGDESPFHFYSAQWFFQQVMQAYFEGPGSDAGIAVRRQQFLQDFDATAERDGLSPEQRELAAPLVAAGFDASIRDRQGFFDKYRRSFFLEDLCPENATRFGVSLEECLG